MCPSKELINRYVSGNCTPDECQRIEKHLAECESCRKQIESVRPTIDSLGQSDAGKTPKEKQSDQAQYPTESMPGVSTMAHSADDFAVQVRPTIEGYDILEHLPRGGQAVVYKAFQKATKRTVAVKVLLQGPHASKQAQYRFEREVDLAASLKHPNIVTIYDSGIAQGQYYYVMEYIRGQVLGKYVKSKNLSTRQIMILFNKVCSAVAYAHQRGVMHRDLKPGNILVGDDGEPHILDFGLAKLVDGSEQNEQTIMTSIAGQVIGTLAFMSPEQAAGQTDAVDIRTDVYSIGVILYKVMTGQFPYDITGAMLATLQNIQQNEPIRPSSIMRINSEIEAIILKALEKEPERRYQSAAEMQQDVRGWLQGMPISAKSASSIYLLKKLIIRNQAASVIVGLVLVILLSTTFISLFSYNKARTAVNELQSREGYYKKQAQRNLAISYISIFETYLEFWHIGLSEKHIGIKMLINNNSREGIAARFLRDERAIPEKIEGFREELSAKGDQSSFFAFVLAEHYIKQKNEQEAIKAYRECLEAGKNSPDTDNWFQNRTKRKLNELTGEKIPIISCPATKTKN